MRSQTSRAYRRCNDLHVWQITSGRNSMTAHLVVTPPITGADSFVEAVQRAAKELGIEHSSIQVEA
jgi:cobalt-zinc-cadmium efflux system protein